MKELVKRDFQKYFLTEILKYLKSSFRYYVFCNLFNNYCLFLFQIFGSGTPMRQFIYSLDLARLLIWVIRSYEVHFFHTLFKLTVFL